MDPTMLIFLLRLHHFPESFYKQTASEALCGNQAVHQYRLLFIREPVFYNGKTVESLLASVEFILRGK